MILMNFFQRFANSATRWNMICIECIGDPMDSPLQTTQIFVPDKLPINSTLVLLDHPSSPVKDSRNPVPVDDLVKALKSTSVSAIYTHNNSYKYDTLAGVTRRLLEALDPPRYCQGYIVRYAVNIRDRINRRS